MNCLAVVRISSKCPWQVMNEVDVEIPVSEISDETNNVDRETDSACTTGTAVTAMTSTDYYHFEQETAAQIIGGFSALTFDLGIVIGLLLFTHLVRRWFV